MRKPLKSKSKKNNKVVKIDERMDSILNAWDVAIESLNYETSLINNGEIDKISDAQDKKDQAIINIEREKAKIQDSGFMIEKGSPEANALEVKLLLFQEALNHNTDVLQGAGEALQHIQNLMKNISDKNNSEGMYNKTAIKITSSDKKIVGLDMKV